jgi:pimeloyl-ACP methyl ester carboxylesterase
MPERGVWRRAGRVARVVAKWAAIVVALVLIAAATYEHVGAWRDGQVLKQVGRSVDVGGRALNIHCVGQGSPTVVFVSGRIAPGYVWTPAQRGVSAFTRACWYDRADLGWSDSGPDPAWGDQAARDLHRLVQHAPLARPLVLVGHSFGGYVIRLYHHAYPGEVSGMVFVDTALEDAGRIRGMPHRDRPNIPRSMIRGLSVVFGRLGMMRMLEIDPGPPLKDWTAEEWDMLARLRRQRNLALADAQVGPERATADLQRQLAARSRRGRQVLVADRGHGMPMEAPGAIVSAVREIVTSGRQGVARR